MVKIKPIYIMNELGIDDWQIEVVLQGVTDVCRIAGIVNVINIINLGAWRDDNYIINNKLQPYKSIDWYILQGKKNSRSKNQLNADKILKLCSNDRWQVSEPHYKIILLRNDIYSNGTYFVIGLALENMGTILSINRFLCLEKKVQSECIKTEAMHELGHVFGLIPDSRDYEVKDELGKHCANICVMRQGLNVPKDWINITEDRIKYGPFCKSCKNDLIKYFQTG